MIYRVISGLFTIYFYVLFAYALMSWVPGLNQTKLGQWLYRLSEPYIGLFRRRIKPLSIGGGYIDVSWIVAIVALEVLKWAILYLLQQLLYSM